MKFITYEVLNRPRVGILIEDKILDFQNSASLINVVTSSQMSELLLEWEQTLDTAENILLNYQKNSVGEVINLSSVKLLAPVPHPTSCRDGYAFRQHVETARRNRGVEMIPEFDQFPVFYFTNHNAIFGEGELFLEIDHFDKLDFELECAIVIGKKGKNILSSEADKYIAGYMIMNDISARTLQMDEMKLNLGPAKGKDFATSIGPWLVTPDELKPYAIETEFGLKHKLNMKALHNGKQISEGNLADMNWTFAEIIERASYGVTLYPGDVIGSGTVGTGCYLELNGTAALQAKENGETFTPTWIKENDEITLEIEGLGRLTNKFKISPNSYSLMKKKKNI